MYQKYYKLPLTPGVRKLRGMLLSCARQATVIINEKYYKLPLRTGICKLRGILLSRVLRVLSYITVGSCVFLFYIAFHLHNSLPATLQKAFAAFIPGIGSDTFIWIGRTNLNRTHQDFLPETPSKLANIPSHTQPLRFFGRLWAHIFPEPVALG